MKIYEKHNWEKVDRVPHWTWKRLGMYSLCTFQYRIVKGKHYIYKASCEDNGGEQGHHRDYNLHRKKRVKSSKTKNQSKHSHINNNIVQHIHNCGDNIGTQVKDSLVQRSNIGTGTKKCMNCGTDANLNEKFCNECGTKFEVKI